MVTYVPERKRKQLKTGTLSYKGYYTPTVTYTDDKQIMYRNVCGGVYGSPDDVYVNVNRFVSRNDSKVVDKVLFNPIDVLFPIGCVSVIGNHIRDSHHNTVLLLDDTKVFEFIYNYDVVLVGSVVMSSFYEGETFVGLVNDVGVSLFNKVGQVTQGNIRYVLVNKKHDECDGLVMSNTGKGMV